MFGRAAGFQIYGANADSDSKLDGRGCARSGEDRSTRQRIDRHEGRNEPRNAHDFRPIGLGLQAPFVAIVGMKMGSRAILLEPWPVRALGTGLLPPRPPGPRRLLPRRNLSSLAARILEFAVMRRRDFEVLVSTWPMVIVSVRVLPVLAGRHVSIHVDMPGVRVLVLVRQKPDAREKRNREQENGEKHSAETTTVALPPT